VASRRAVALALLAAGAALGCALRRDPPPGASGALIYELQNCANCHGADGAGTPRGPELADLAAHWSRAELARFLAEPGERLERDGRLQALRAAYRGSMSSYDNLSEEQRLLLADHLLGAGWPTR
jgi:mono/diheme cytochrome c family protein